MTTALEGQLVGAKKGEASRSMANHTSKLLLRDTLQKAGLQFCQCRHTALALPLVRTLNLQASIVTAHSPAHHTFFLVASTKPANHLEEHHLNHQTDFFLACEGAKPSRQVCPSLPTGTCTTSYFASLPFFRIQMVDQCQS